LTNRIIDAGENVGLTYKRNNFIYSNPKDFVPEMLSTFNLLRNIKGLLNLPNVGKEHDVKKYIKDFNGGRQYAQ